MEVKKDIVIRLSLVYVFALVVAILIIGQTFYLQFSTNPKYKAMASNVEYRTIKSTPDRGNICAYDGKVLATSLPFFEIRMDLASKAMNTDTFYRYVHLLSDSLSHLFKDKSSEKYYNELYKAKKDADGFFLIKPEVTYQEYLRLKRFPIFNKGKYKGGFIAIKKNKRILPYKNLAARTIGSIQNGNYIGIEGSFNSELTGEEREKLFKKIGQNWIPIDNEESYQQLSGKDVITTLDINFQDFAHNALLEQMTELNADTGTVILMEVKTGEIKAIVNLVNIGEGRFIEGSNYAIGMSIEPGSTFKLASFITALEDGYIDLKDSVQTGNGFIRIHNFPIREAGRYGYGKLSVKQVFEKSSNVGTALLIYNNYKDYPEKFVKRLNSMELDKKVGIEIFGEPQPQIKYPRHPLWSGITLPQMAIGYEVLLTPLQTLNFYNAIANNGVMVKPRLVNAIREHGKIIKEFHTQITNPSICSKATLERAKIILEGVVKNGTAKNIDGTPYKIAGKTGTAQVAEGNTGYSKEGNLERAYFGSFVGYFPADNPVYSCIVVIKTKDPHKFYGNLVAAPVFRKIADKVYASSLNMQQEISRNLRDKSKTIDVPYSKNGYLNDLEIVYRELRIPIKGRDKIRSAWVLTKESDKIIEYQNRYVRREQVPMVLGMGLKDAVYLLESVGLKVKVLGMGTVQGQSIEPGAKVQKNETITITLG
jgi:cell division protein FtsI (penicillin-binding protein 3)